MHQGALPVTNRGQGRKRIFGNGHWRANTRRATLAPIGGPILPRSPPLTKLQPAAQNRVSLTRDPTGQHRSGRPSNPCGDLTSAADRQHLHLGCSVCTQVVVSSPRRLLIRIPMEDFRMPSRSSRNASSLIEVRFIHGCLPPGKNLRPTSLAWLAVRGAPLVPELLVECQRTCTRAVSNTISTNMSSSTPPGKRSPSSSGRSGLPSTLI